MARKDAPARPAETPPGLTLSDAEMALFERLIEAGALIAKPSRANAKPRKVVAAGLSHGGRQIILWLSPKVIEPDDG